MEPKNENHIAFVGERWEYTTNFRNVATYGSWKIEVGRGNKKDLAKLNRLINFVNNSSDEEFRKNYDKYLNLDATINYIILMEFANLIDNAAKNMLITTYDGKVWYPSLYDLDTLWGTSCDGVSIIDYKETSFVKDNKLWKRILDNFPNEIYNRYIELRKEILTKEHVMELFYEFRNLIPTESFEKEKSDGEIFLDIIIFK